MALARAIRARLVTAYRRTPPIYKWKNRHGWLFQRMRGGVHGADFQVLRSLDVASPLVIDVGANTGQTIQTVKTLLPQARGVSIEPRALPPARAAPAASWRRLGTCSAARVSACESW